MTPLERAKADLIRFQRELSRLKAQVVILENQIERIEAYIEMAPVYESNEAHSEATKLRGTGISAISVRLSIDAIRALGRRIHTRDLLRILQDQGVVVGGTNPIANLSGFLSRSDELHNSRADGWGLAEWVEAPQPDKPKLEQRPGESPRPRPETPSTDASEENPKGHPGGQPIVRRAWNAPWNDDQPSKEPAKQDAGSDLDDEIPF